MCFFRNCKFL